MSLRRIAALLLYFACLQLVLSSDTFRSSRRLVKKSESRGDGDDGIFETNGKFNNKAQTQPCTWLARGENPHTLTVRCSPENGKDFSCTYTGRPQLCTGYSLDPKGFWKQIARSLKKQMRKLCVDRRARIRAGMCKSAPLAAHFALSETSNETQSSTEKSTARPDTESRCTERVDHGEVAKEKCGDSWASLCVFLFTIIQSREC